MAANENKPTSNTVWYFISATFIIALPMMLFPEMPWWARTETILFGGALIVVGIRRLKRENTQLRRLVF